MPVFTATWIETTGCPGDSTFNPASGDVSVVSFPQNLDFTTDSTTTSFVDIDGDGCSLAGSGPIGPVAATGTCLHYLGLSVTTVATGPIGSSDTLDDLSFVMTLPNTFTPGGGPGGTVCGTSAFPPPGLSTRCIP